MHYRIVLYIQGMILKIEALLLLLPAVTGLVTFERECIAFFFSAVLCFCLGAVITRKKPDKFVFYAREGVVAVALSWIVISIFGALPLWLNGDIPSYTDALFETISGFTTTGASILTDVEALSHASLIWRSFTHWVGGMGVIVFMLAIIPMTGGYNAQLMQAESPGPSFGKLQPKLKDSASMLYKIYLFMTVVEIILLLWFGMPVFDSLCLSFGTAGTGGFGVRNSSIADYTLIQQAIITVFMILFGVNFNAYFLLTTKKRGEAFKIEEVRWYLIIIFGSIAAITLNIWRSFGSPFLAFHHAAFQVGSIITTTGYATVDFDVWPMFSRMILLTLMFIGACAGSTGGGIKVSRILILMKSIKQQLVHYLHPRAVTVMKIDGKVCDKQIVSGTATYLATYVVLFTLSLLALSLDPRFDFTTDFSAVAATINNIGPGLGAVGPTCNYHALSVLSKYVLMFDMLAGRLELYPMLIMLMPSAWSRR